MRSITASDPKERADIEDNFRKTVGQALGGIAVLDGAGVAYYGTQQTLQVNKDQTERTQRAAHNLLISNQIAKGFEQLGSEKIVVRLGGIYALEGVMNDPDAVRYNQSVLEALGAFVRDGTKDKIPDSAPATDIQAALTVLGRRKQRDGHDYPNFFSAYPDLFNAQIPRAYLMGANLSGANLMSANLSGALLIDANLVGAT